MLNCQKHLFSLPEEITYLNNAYMSPLLKSVEQAGHEGIRMKSRPYEVSVGHFFDPVQRLKAAIDEHTALVTLGHVHWADGTLFDLKAIRRKTAEAGTWLVVDGTQSVGALPFDVQEIQPDALICAGYKWLMGPYSCWSVSGRWGRSK